MYQSNAKLKDLVNVIFQYSLVLIVNKHTRVNKKQRETIIDYIIFNSFTDQENLTGILKPGISDHVPVFTISMKHRLYSSETKVKIRKRVTNVGSMFLSHIRYCIPSQKYLG